MLREERGRDEDRGAEDAQFRRVGVGQAGIITACFSPPARVHS